MDKDKDKHWFWRWSRPYDTELHMRAYRRFVSGCRDVSEHVRQDIGRALNQMTDESCDQKWTPDVATEMMRAHAAVRGTDAYVQGMLFVYRACLHFAPDAPVAWWSAQRLLGRTWMFYPPCSGEAAAELRVACRRHFPNVWEVLESDAHARVQWAVLLSRYWSVLFTGCMSTYEDIDAVWNYLFRDSPSRRVMQQRMAAVHMSTWLYGLPSGHDVDYCRSEPEELMAVLVGVEIAPGSGGTIVATAKSFYDALSKRLC